MSLIGRVWGIFTGANGKLRGLRINEVSRDIFYVVRLMNSNPFYRPNESQALEKLAERYREKPEVYRFASHSARGDCDRTWNQIRVLLKDALSLPDMEDLFAIRERRIYRSQLEMGKDEIH